MFPRFEAVRFTPAEIPTPVPGQLWDLRLMSQAHGWAVLDHDAQRAAVFSRPSLAMDAARRLNAGALSAELFMTLPPRYFHQLTKWSANHGQI